MVSFDADAESPLRTACSCGNRRAEMAVDLMEMNFSRFFKKTYNEAPVGFRKLRRDILDSAVFHAAV